MVHTWAKDYVIYDAHNAEPIHVFFSGSGGTGKSHLVKSDIQRHIKNIALYL